LAPGAEADLKGFSAPGGTARAAKVTTDPRGTRVAIAGRFDRPETLSFAYRPGIEIADMHEPLLLGDVPQRLRIIDARLDGRVYAARVQGRRGRTYQLQLTVPFQLISLEGAREIRTEGARRRVEVSLPAGEGDWTEATIRLTVGQRLAR
jgi:hypothetical protein